MSPDPNTIVITGALLWARARCGACAWKWDGNTVHATDTARRHALKCPANLSLTIRQEATA